PYPWSAPGALDANRIFVDWPLSSRSNIGQLSRSTDAGDSFRLLFDPTCSPRSRPMCTTGGGGDTEADVNQVNGFVFFGDQEVLAQEALASSTDHGDTFPLGRQYAASNSATGVDRQWIATIDPSIATDSGQAIHAFYAYHVPAAGQYMSAVLANGLPAPGGPVTQVQGVGQSGQIRADSTNGPGRGRV